MGDGGDYPFVSPAFFFLLPSFSCPGLGVSSCILAGELCRRSYQPNYQGREVAPLMRHHSEVIFLQLLQGDCLELLKDIPDGSVDMVLTDPPYGIDYQSQRKKNKSEWMPKIKNDKRPFIDFIPLIKRVLTSTGCVMVFTRWDVQQKFIDEMNGNGLKVKNVLIWDKEIHGMGDLKHSFASRYESIIFSSEKGFLFNGKRPQDIIKFRRVLPNELKHPNEKPVGLLEWLVSKCTRQNETVFDPFMGSGSTGVACVNTGRNFIGMEFDPGYFEMAKRRIEEAQRQNGM